MTVRPGTLYLVATPIGNAADLSPRGRQVLEEADLIAAEDTRRSMVLMNKLGIRNRLVSNHRFNEHGRAGWFVEQLRDGKSVAVITDAGTPCISDPGNELVIAVLEAGLPVTSIPGCCAAVNALTLTGFDLTSFAFLGFFPREASERRAMLDAMRRDPVTRTFCVYESPKRILGLVEFLLSENANVRLCVVNDMTKLHEQAYRGTPQEVYDALLEKETYDKGEYAVVLELPEEYRYRREEHLVTPEALLVDAMVRGLDTRSAIEAVLQDQNNTYSRNELKSAAIRLKRLFAV